MNCGMNGDDQEVLGADSTAAPTICDTGGMCSESNCGNKGGEIKSRTCKRDQKCGAFKGSWAREDASDGSSSACMKCKTERAVVLVRQREPLCKACLEAGISGKVRSLKSNKLLAPGDHVALAFSGGCSSQALLCNVLAMRKDASTPRKERGKIEFALSVLHINEATAHGASREAADAHGRAVQAAAQRCGAGGAASEAVHVIPLSDVFLWLDEGADDGDDGAGVGRSRLHWQRPLRGLKQPQEPPTEQSQPELQSQLRAMSLSRSRLQQEPERSLATAAGLEVEQAAATAAEAEAREEREARLQALLQSVPDPTGREDLVRHLRGRLLGAVAARGLLPGMGAASKLLVGDTASALAARILADTAKGRGYSLPGGIQLVDGRGVPYGEPPVLQPMREVTLKEAVFFCRLRGLHPVQLPYNLRRGGDRRSVNALAAAFVDSLQVNLPSTIFTILRTAMALKPFPFNTPEAATVIATPTPPAAAASYTATGRGAEDDSEPTGGGDGSSGGGAPSAGSVAGTVSAAAAAASAAALPSCCALCRAPLTRREREAIAAAAAAAAAARSSWLQWDAAESTSESKGQRIASRAAAVAAEGGSGEEAEEAEEAAPFCNSCRSQVLFTPEQAAGAGESSMACGSTLLGGGGTFVAGNVAASKTLPLLPAALR